jgi:Tfp pilus assembly protein PilO
MAMNFSTKRVQIDKAKTLMVGIIAGAAFIVVFSLVVSKALLSQRGYQSRVIKEQEAAVKQLRENIKNVEQLTAAYKQFVEQPTNVLSGNSSGQGDRDGDNAKIILDALPSKYDFPALTTSLEKILTDRKFKITDITGIDDEVAQINAQNSAAPTPVEIPYGFKVTGSYDSVKDLMDILQRSIRPFKVQKLVLDGTNSSLNLDVTALTYYLPEKQLNFQTKEVQ